MSLGSIGNQASPIHASALDRPRDWNGENSLREGATLLETPKEDEGPLKEAFRDFVGQTFFGQLIASMRSTQGEPAYFHGGRAEEIFQGQLDQQLAETISEKSASKVADPMYELFALRRK